MPREIPFECETFADWISTYAKEHGFAVMAIVWSKKANEPAITVVEGAEQSPEFSRLLAHTLLSQSDLSAALYRAAMERVEGYEPDIESRSRNQVKQ